jgi:type II secretory ATPase GspE/PulE/Tfp pilus assembly ATPase PilB-like protein
VVEKRLPQDGRAIIKIHDKSVDLRISIIPSIYGENVVIRILPVHLLFNLEDLGLTAEESKIMEELMRKPHGIIFLTGPTGSGKTTTLYACLSRLNKEGVKIITIEDPVEYELKGVMQIQIKPEIGFTFATALRSILRHDPDIMMVGEVRDLETAELAIRTALTGHLIFSTLHTNDAPSGSTRLLDIGIEPYLVASSANAFISQRLVRVICPACKEERVDKGLLPDAFKKMKLYYGKGCDNCRSIGFKGRIAIYEILVVNEDIKEMILNKASASQIRKKAQELGLKTLMDSGIEKVKAGLTTPEEILRIAEVEE